MRDVPSSYPGHEVVRVGLDDLAAGRESEASLVVAMARTRLEGLGFDVPPGGGSDPSHRLYELMTRSERGAHSSYNALTRRVVSFVRAAERASSG